MNDNDYKLSICIPTYNRVDLLKESILSVLKAIEFSKFNIEVIISDNHSNDKTEEFCTYLTNSYTFINYYRNEENLNELNFYIAAQRAKSSFVWLFSDDDILNINSIKIVCDKLSDGFNFVITNYDLYDNKLKVIKKKNFLELSENLVINDKNNLLVALNLKLGFISCVIFDRKAFLGMPIEIFDKYRPYGFPFVYGIYSSLNENLNAIIISETLLIQRGASHPADINWWYKCFVEGSSKIFNELLIFGYNKQSINKAQKFVFSKYVISDLLWRKTQGNNSYEAISFIFIYYKKFFFKFLYSLIIILMPSFIFKYSYKLKKYLRHEYSL
jgi:glycosyltransferase involved in cell wall biosynthesis